MPAPLDELIYAAAGRTSQSCALSMGGKSCGEEGEFGGRSSRRRRKPSISPGTAEFLAQIEKVSVFIIRVLYMYARFLRCGARRFYM